MILTRGLPNAFRPVRGWDSAGHVLIDLLNALISPGSAASGSLKVFIQDANVPLVV